MRFRDAGGWRFSAATTLLAIQLISCRGSVQVKCEPSDCNKAFCPPCTDPRLPDPTRKPPTTNDEPKHQAVSSGLLRVKP